jgi:hypothetical protein
MAAAAAAACKETEGGCQPSRGSYLTPVDRALRTLPANTCVKCISCRYLHTQHDTSACGSIGRRGCRPTTCVGLGCEVTADVPNSGCANHDNILSSGVLQADAKKPRLHNNSTPHAGLPHQRTDKTPPHTPHLHGCQGGLVDCAAPRGWAGMARTGAPPPSPFQQGMLIGVLQHAIIWELVKQERVA